MRHPKFRFTGRPSQLLIIKLYLVGRIRRRHGFGGICRCGADALHNHMRDKHGRERFVAAVALDTRDGFYDI